MESSGYGASAGARHTALALLGEMATRNEWLAKGYRSLAEWIEQSGSMPKEAEEALWDLLIRRRG